MAGTPLLPIFGALRHRVHDVAILTICNHKGGTGKTTSSVHLAAAFGLMGHRVLLVDLDPQGFLTRTVGAEEPARDASSLALIDPEGDLRSLPVQSFKHFDVLGASMQMTREQRRLTRPTDVFWMRETFAEGHDYDLVLIDTAAAVSVFTMNALVASDAVLIPVTPEYQPVVGAEQTWQTCRLVKSRLNPGLQVPRFLLTQVDGRLSRHARYSEYLRGQYEGHVLSTPIRTSSSLAVASRNGRTVYDQPKMTRGALDYAHAAEEIAGVFFPSLVRPAPVEGAPDLAEDLDDELVTPLAQSVRPDSVQDDGDESPVPAPSRSEPLASPPVTSPAPSPEATSVPAFAPISTPPAPSSVEPPPRSGSRIFHHAPVPGRIPSAPVPTSAPDPDTVADALEQTERALEDAAGDATAAIRAALPGLSPPAPSGDGGADAPNVRRFRF